MFSISPLLLVTFINVSAYIYKMVYASKMSEIRTFEHKLFGFRTEKGVWKPNKFVRISDVFRTEQ